MTTKKSLHGLINHFCPNSKRSQPLSSWEWDAFASMMKHCEHFLDTLAYQMGADFPPIEMPKMMKVMTKKPVISSASVSFSIFAYNNK